MRRRALEIGLPLLAVAALLVILYNATLVDRRPPAIQAIALSAPAGDARVGQTLTAIDIDFSEPVRTGTVERRFAITPQVPGTFRWDGQTTLIFTPNQRLPSDTQFSVQIAAGFEDASGNATTTPTDPWTFRTLGPPVVKSATPTGPQVPVGTTVALTFDRLMATSSVEQAVTVAPTAAYRASWSQQVLTLTFTDDLVFGTTYTVTVGSNATDTDGAHLATPFVFRFTTVVAAVSVLATAPADGVAGVSVRGPITIAFDAAIDPASIGDALAITPPVAGSAAVVRSPEDQPVAPASPSASPTEGPPGRLLVFTPNSPLASHTTYTVTLRPVVSRLGSTEQVAAGRTWTFTTGQPVASAQNQVLFLTARSGIRNVWMMNPDGTNPRQVTAELSPVVGFDITVDGRTLAISSGGVVRVLRIDGSDERVATGAGAFEYAPLFAPDGQSMLVARRSIDGTDQGFWLVPVPGASSVAQRQLLPGGAPATGSSNQTGDVVDDVSGGPWWSARSAFSGTGAAALIGAANGSLRLVDLAKPESVATPIPLDTTGAPIWSTADNSFLIAGRPAGGTSGIYRISLDGAPIRLLDGTGTLATDGRRALAVLQGSGGGTGALHVAYMTRPGLPATVLTTSTELSDRTPVFSPNGEDVLFVRVPTATPTTSSGIWVAGSDGRQLRQLTRDGSNPRWLP